MKRPCACCAHYRRDTIRSVGRDATSRIHELRHPLWRSCNTAHTRCTQQKCASTPGVYTSANARLTACFSPAHEPLRRHFCAGRPCAQTKDRPNLLASTQDGTAELQGRASSPRPHPTLFQSRAGSSIAPRWREVRSWGFVPYAVSWRAQMLAAFLKRNLLATFPRFLHVKNHLLAHFPQSQAAIVATMQAAFQSHERATGASHQSLSCA